MTIDNSVFWYRLSTLLFVTLFVVGCSQYVKVSGTVTYSDTGEPVKFGSVLFDSEKESGRGTIKDGKYSVGRIEDGDGISPGTYTVSSDSPPLPPPPQGPVMIGMDGKPMGPPTSTSTQEREIYYTKEPKTIDVKKSMTYDFQVERGARPR